MVVEDQVAGPVGVKKNLVEFLPVPMVEKDGDRYYLRL